MISSSETNPQLQQIQAKIEFMKSTYFTLSQQHQSNLQKYQKLKSSNRLVLEENEIQKKKSKALMLLASQLQRKHDQHLFQTETFKRDSSALSSEKQILKQLLVKQGQQIQLYKQLNHFLKEQITEKNKSQFNSFMDKQSQLSSRIQSKLNQLKNPGFVCRRKWHILQTQNKELTQRVNTLQRQLMRQQSNIKDTYQQYLNKINKYNTKLTYLNNCQDERVISDHLIEQMSIVQRERKSIEDQYNDLKENYQNIQREYEQSKQHKKTIMQLFSENNQETKLANKMRIKIAQLQDLTKDLKLNAHNPKILILSKTIQSVKDEHKKLKDRKQFLKSKYEESINGKASIQEVEVANFFNKVFSNKDQKIDYQSKLNYQMKQRVQDLVNKKSILQRKCMILRQSMQNVRIFQDQQFQTDTKGVNNMRVFTFNKNDLLQ